MNTRYEQELAQVIANKDTVIRNLQERHESIEKQLQEEVAIVKRMWHENADLRKANNEELENAIAMRKGKEAEIKELTQVHIEAENRLADLLKEKDEITDAFETSIRQLRNAHLVDITDKREHVEAKRGLNAELAECLHKTRLRQDGELHKQNAELDESAEQHVNMRRLNDLQGEECARLKLELKSLQRQNEMFVREIELLKTERSKLNVDNDELRNDVLKLDKIV